MEEWYAYREGVQKSPAKKYQVLTRNIFSRMVKSQRHTRGTFMSVLSNESFSHWVCAEVTIPFSAVAPQLIKGGKRMDKTLISGSMAMLVLKLLSEGDKYGYEMIETLRQRSQNVFELKAGTLYPLLHNLEEKKMLVSYEKEVLGKVRKYYSITKEGRKMLASKEDEWRKYSKAVLHVLA